MESNCKCHIFILAVFLLFLGTFKLSAQVTDALGTYSPYSLFGIGELEKQGSAYNYSMGGIGVGIRDKRFINVANPAAVTERDSLSFMLDFGVIQKNNYNSDYKTKSAYNVFNMQNIVLSFPIYKKSAVFVGVMPFSNTGYKFESTETDPNIVSQLGDVKYQKYGTGSINQLFVGAAFQFAKYFSFGAEAIYYFGSLNRHSNVIFNTSSQYNKILTGWEYKLDCFSGKVGLQYYQPIKKNNSVLTIGATYRLGNNLDGPITRYIFSESPNTAVSDTVLFDQKKDLKIKIASEMATGVSYRVKDKWMIGFDYLRQNWKNSSFAESTTVDFEPAIDQSFRLGFEYIPNRYDIRYYMKRVSYRCGAYYDQSYISFNGNQVTSFGITLGASFPIYKWYNAVSVAVELGQRGMRKEQLVRERYVNFLININLHDIWFIKFRYE